MVENALKQNYKSYGAWHHRKRVLRKGQSFVDHELRLLDQFQKADALNFHAWSYHRFVAALKRIPDEDELKNTTDMIERNFSNYSAWHNRSVILSNLLKKKPKDFSPRKRFYMGSINSSFRRFLQILMIRVAGFIIFGFLTSSLPAPGSEVALSVTRDTAGTIHVVIYFDQPVTGVNSSTVVVKYAFSKK